MSADGNHLSSVHEIFSCNGPLHFQANNIPALVRHEQYQFSKVHLQLYFREIPAREKSSCTVSCHISNALWYMLICNSDERDQI